MNHLSEETVAAILKRGRIYEVGGAVRDRLLSGSKATKDCDYLVTGVGYDELSRLLKQHGRVDLVGRSFGVIKYTQFTGGRGHTFDLTLPRREHSTGWGHKEFAVSFDPSLPVEEDLVRRDFTVNAMAVALDNNELIDPLNGRMDLDNRQLRMVYPTSFEDDPLRMLRAVQFAARFGFMIEPETFRAIRKNAALIETVSAERIAEELNKLLTLAQIPSSGFRLMQTLGLLKVILPELQTCVGVDQPGGYHKYDVFEHTMHIIDSCDARLRLRMAALFHDVTKPQARRLVDGGATFYGHEGTGAKVAASVLRRLRYSNGFIKQVATLVERHMFTTEVTPKGLRRLVRRVGVDLIHDLLDLRRADVVAQGMGGTTEDVDQFETDIREELERKPPLSVTDLAIDGRVMMELFQLEPGPAIGRVLSYLLERVLDDPNLNSREILTTLAREQIEQKETLSDKNNLKERDK
ncbi:MAG: CCA tRNA nucleotidyltransferase [candidate division Zixibacteria bacterium]|nr:CCA tRNA nucleotidyltransferase [candidate division Zixibacteria bacterium]MDH3937929.1 CCA tRNA nucleotidyltransferase [candidate division Zixibacteria bacterium]MDH4034117.1 CCA tRNA nucleotidyltransferase [candidate division Zixibacteria bacterium]